MSDLYKITKESLLELAKKIYEEGCCGYMDLADAISEKMVNDFIKDKNTIKISSTAASITNAINSHYVNPPAIPHERIAENIAERVLNSNATWTTYNPTWAVGVDTAHLNSFSADALWHPTSIEESVRPETILRNDTQLRNNN